MSHDTYNTLWKQAHTAITDLLEIEQPEEPPKPERDRLTAFQNVATMYVKYIQIFRKLESSYDQIVHPQKRRVLRHVLDGTIGRILELKGELTGLEFSEFHYFDDILSDLKLTPNDIEMPIPKYFTLERSKVLKDREKLLGQIMAKMGPQDKDMDREKLLGQILAKMGPQDKDMKEEEKPMSLEESIRIIQVHERARQGRLRAKFMREIRMQEERERQAANRGAPTIEPDTAAIRIQKVWKGFAQRKRTKREREEEMMFIGMTPLPGQTVKNTPQYLATKTESARRVTQEEHEREYQQALVTIKEKLRESARRVTQEEHEREYQQALVTIKEKLREVEGPEMKESMQDQIRQWFIEVRDATGKFPDYPDEDEGGSAMIFKEKTPEEVEAEMAAKAEEKGKKKGKKGKKGKKSGKKEKKGKKGKKGKGKKGKGDDEEEEEPGFKLAPSEFVPALSEGNTSYQGVWKERDEMDNFSQKHDAELIKEDKRKEVETEVRLQVDELMREELKNLKAAVERDKGKKGKKGKKSGKKKKKKGKKSGKKGKKGKKEKDLTADRTIESLYEELVQEGILVRCPKVHMSDYLGEYSYLGTTLRTANIEPMPSLHDVRRVVTEYGVLPIGSQAVHEKAPLVKSLLLTGPRGTGKKMLVHAICTETGANLFDLTCTNIAGKYPGKSGLAMMMHMVFKVARQLQPSVIFIGDAEKTFLKKVPKTDPSDPKRLKKDLPKAIKGMKAEDRVVVVGTSRQPFDCELKALTGCYQKIILIPRPDYASRFLMWRSMIQKGQGILTNHMDVSSLSKVTDGYTPAQMWTAVQQVLTDRRIQQLSKRPLMSVEFISPLARIDPIYKEEEEAFKSWNEKTPLGKKRAKAAKGDDEEDGGGGKGKKGKKGKKSGKKGKKKKKK